MDLCGLVLVFGYTCFCIEDFCIVVCLRLTYCILHVERGEEWDHDDGFGLREHFSEQNIISSLLYNIKFLFN